MVLMDVVFVMVVGLVLFKVWFGKDGVWLVVVLLYFVWLCV